MRTTGRTTRGFTLIEIILAMAILSVVIGAIYSTWAGVVKAARVGEQAAAAAQRERMAVRVVEEALAGAQLFVANPTFYSFEADKDGKVALSLVSSLPRAFPRSGKFGEALMRRVMFSVEAGQEYSQKQLVMRQCPILMEMDEDERLHPVVLADNVRDFNVELWDNTKNDWVDTWIYTNQLPKMVRVTLQLNDRHSSGATVADAPLITVVGLPTDGVQASWQLPNVSGGQPQPNNNRGNTPAINPPGNRGGGNRGSGNMNSGGGGFGGGFGGGGTGGRGAGGGRRGN